MNLNEKIERTISIRKEIFKQEVELANLINEIELEMLDNAKFEDNLEVGCNIVKESENKRYIVEKLEIYFNNDTLLPYISPTIRRMRPDGITPGNVIGTDNYIFTQTLFLDEFIEKVGNTQEKFHTSAIKVASCNNMKDFFVANKVDKKEQSIKKVKGYTHQSGYSSFSFPEDELLDIIVSHKTAPSNMKSTFRHEHFLEIITKDNRQFIYTEKQYKNKAVRLTQKKIADIKKMILENDERLLEYTDTDLHAATYFTSYFHNLYIKENANFIELFLEYLTKSDILQE